MVVYWIHPIDSGFYYAGNFSPEPCNLENNENGLNDTNKTDYNLDLFWIFLGLVVMTSAFKILFFKKKSTEPPENEINPKYKEVDKKTAIQLENRIKRGKQIKKRLKNNK